MKLCLNWAFNRSKDLLKIFFVLALFAQTNLPIQKFYDCHEDDDDDIGDDDDDSGNDDDDDGGGDDDDDGGDDDGDDGGGDHDADDKG